jgi:hypothetical protein
MGWLVVSLRFINSLCAVGMYVKLRAPPPTHRARVGVFQILRQAAGDSMVFAITSDVSVAADVI